MAEKISNIYQFKIVLKYTTPKIWRRIQVPEDYDFEDLHMAIQNSMGWMDCHLHQFNVKNPKTGRKEVIGVPNDEGYFKVIPEDEVKIADYFLSPKDKAYYMYDFGDGWQHAIVLEKILPAVLGATYPQCLAGEMACPPENSGGVSGYENLLEILADPNHEEYKERIEWLDETLCDGFDPVKFDPKSVTFF